MNAFTSFWAQLVGIINTVEFVDVLDVLCVAYLIYKLIKLVRETRAEQLLKGIIILLVGTLLVTQLRFRAMSYILNYFFQFGVIAACVLFQPELRRALEQVGRSKLGNINVFPALSDDLITKDSDSRRMISAVVDAVSYLSLEHTGALIVLERKTRLGDIVKTGTIVDARATKELICNIFFPNASLHDGGMIIRNGRVYAAGCFLPLSQNYEISKDLGTRHRAALGMSENSDALVVVVSEETGIISTAENGVLRRGFDPAQLRALLEEYFLPEIKEETHDRKSFLRKVKR